MRKKKNRKKTKRLKRRKKIRKEIPKISLKAIKGLKIDKKIKQLKELNQLLNRKKNRIINKQINRLKGFSLRNSANLISQSFNKVYEDFKKELQANAKNFLNQYMKFQGESSRKLAEELNNF